MHLAQQPVNEPEVRDLTLKQIGTALDRHSASLTPPQQYLAGRLATGTMADWVWQSDVSPNQERKYSHPRTTSESANLIAQSAVGFARSQSGSHGDMNELAVSPAAHTLRAEALQSLRQLLDRHARGQ